jgi:hypothetical protein
MTSKNFKKYLDKIIELDGLFVTDTIDMKGIETPMDEVMYVAGDDEKEVFLIHIQKI